MQKLESEIMDKLNITLQPMTLKEETGTLKQEIKELKDKIILLDQTLRRKHIKCCGLPEEMDSSQDLLSKINLWLNDVLEIRESRTSIA